MTRERASYAVRRLARVTDEQVALLAGAEGREALLEGIVAMPDPQPAPRRRRRRRVAVVSSALGLTLAASATIGWAVFVSSTRDTTSLQCDIDGNPSIVAAMSGDAVVDCAEEWLRQTGSAAPPLLAYDNGHGGILVTPATAAPPAGAKPLPPGPQQNVALIELEESLGDYGDGRSARCFDEAAAVAYATAETERLGLTEWAVRTRDSAGPCYDGVVDATTRSVVLIPRPDVVPANPHDLLARKLREIARGCRPLGPTKKAVEDAAADLGLSPAPDRRQYQLVAVANDAACTSIRQRVGGTIFITLRGPAG